MSLVVFPTKNSAATIFLNFDFISSLAAGETLTSQNVTAIVDSGTDATPSAIISGAATVAGFIVSQKIVAGVVGVIYLLTCSVTTSLGNQLVLQGRLAVVDSNPFQP